VADDLKTTIASGAVTALRRRSRTSDRARVARNGRVRQDARRVHPHRGGGISRSPANAWAALAQEMKNAP
jgi:hypothetical protein